MTLECCCRRPHEFQFCRQPIPHTGCSDRERRVSESPLRPWKEEVAVAGGAQRRACWYVADRTCEQVGDYSLVCGRRMSYERADTACTRSVVQWVINATRGGRELHGHVVSGRERVSLPRLGLAAAVPELPLGDRRGLRCSSPVVTAQDDEPSVDGADKKADLCNT